MIEMSDTIEIDASVERVYDCLVQSLQNLKSYRAWHPEHESIEWLRGRPVEEGESLKRMAEGTSLPRVVQAVKDEPS